FMRCLHRELQKATHNFTMVIGQGAFGPVYRAQMSTGETVAVKVLATDSRQGEKEFQTENAITRTGSVVGVYVGMEYGMERIRGTRDWVLQKNAMLGGALTGAIVFAATNSSRDKVVMDAIAGGAIVTAAEILN
ncbi:hypothetical protein IFM89_017865, partial [Coptis chinensis]